MRPLRRRLEEARARLGVPWEVLERDYLLSAAGDPSARRRLEHERLESIMRPGLLRSLAKKPAAPPPRIDDGLLTQFVDRLLEVARP